ncbi:MAG: hypothetical protein K0Q47_68 [Sedimentibacter sp.]|jgi:hypothetical protein|nr:hypothetical protein [Sedimentibacter sp.]
MEKYIFDYKSKSQILFEHPLDIIVVIEDLVKDIGNYNEIADYLDTIYIHGLTLLEMTYVSGEIAKFLSQKKVSTARMQYILEDKYKDKAKLESNNYQSLNQKYFTN